MNKILMLDVGEGPWAAENKRKVAYEILKRTEDGAREGLSFLLNHPILWWRGGRSLTPDAVLLHLYEAKTASFKAQRNGEPGE